MVVHRLIATRNIEYQRCLGRYAAHRCRLVEIVSSMSHDPDDFSNEELYWEGIDEDMRNSDNICKRIDEINNEMSLACLKGISEVKSTKGLSIVSGFPPAMKTGSPH